MQPGLSPALPCRYDVVMLRELTGALVDAIKNHQKDAVSDLFKILGVIAGGISGILLESWRKRGTVSIMPMDMGAWRYGGTSFKVYEPAYRGTEEPPGSIAFGFKYRVLNRYSDPKGLALLGIEFFPKRPRWWHASATLSTFDLRWKVVGEEVNPNDIYLPAHSFTQILVQGAAMPVNDDKLQWPTALQDFRYVRLRCLVTPRKQVSVVYRFAGKDIPNVDQEPYLTHYIQEARSALPLTERTFKNKPINELNRARIEDYKRVLAEFPKRLEALVGKSETGEAARSE